MILHWIQKRPDLVLQWLGPNKVTSKALSSIQEVESKLAVIMGPKGQDGVDGAPGPQGPPGPVTIVDGAVLIDTVDGGFF